MGNLNTNYQGYRCYAILDDASKNLFDAVVGHYGRQLNQSCLIGNTLFTPHDFNKHCNNIYRIISNIILPNASISIKEWLILDLAVLFHDISLSGKLPSSFQGIIIHTNQQNMCGMNGKIVVAHLRTWFHPWIYLLIMIYMQYVILYEHTAILNPIYYRQKIMV